VVVSSGSCWVRDQAWPERTCKSVSDNRQCLRGEPPSAAAARPTRLRRRRPSGLWARVPCCRWITHSS
jgi:hypothetical protein